MIPMMGINWSPPPTLQVSMSLRTLGMRWGSSTERASYYSPFFFKLKSATSSNERVSSTSFPRKVNNNNNIMTRMMASATNGEDA